MSSTRRATPAALAALALALQSTTAWGETKTLAAGETWLVGQEGDSVLTGSAGDDTIFGDPLARTAPPTSLVVASTGFEQLVPGGPMAHGADANGYSYLASRHPTVFTPDGAGVLISSGATNLIEGFDTKFEHQIYLKRLGKPKSDPDTYYPVSVTADNQAGDHSTKEAVFSPDGSKVAMATLASNLSGGDISARQIVIKDLATGKLTTISRSRTTGDFAAGDCEDPVFSADGTRIAFTSAADNLVPNDGNLADDIFVVDLGDVVDEDDYKTIARASTTSTGMETLGDTSGNPQNSKPHSRAPIFSPDGKHIAFTTRAINLNQADDEYFPDIVLKTLNWTNPTMQPNINGSNELISSKSDGTNETGCYNYPRLFLQMAFQFLFLVAAHNTSPRSHKGTKISLDILQNLENPLKTSLHRRALGAYMEMPLRHWF